MMPTTFGAELDFRVGIREKISRISIRNHAPHNSRGEAEPAGCECSTQREKCRDIIVAQPLNSRFPERRSVALWGRCGWFDYDSKSAVSRGTIVGRRIRTTGGRIS